MGEIKGTGQITGDGTAPGTDVGALDIETLFDELNDTGVVRHFGIPGGKRREQQKEEEGKEKQKAQDSTSQHKRRERGRSKTNNGATAVPSN